MLRVLVGSEDLKAVSSEESFNASNFRSHLFFLDDRGSLSLARSSTWQDTTSKLPVIRLEGEQTHHLMEKDERLSTHFTGMTSNDTTMQTLPQIGCPYCYPSCYSAFESGRTAAAAHGFHFRHEGQTHHNNKPQEMHFIKVEDGSQFEALAANAAAPQTSIVDCDLYSSDAASDTYHQTDDINDLFAISETVSSLIAEGTTPRRAPITILDECISQGSEPSPHEAEWTSAENVASSVSPRPWLEIPTPTADNILAAVSTSYSMIAAQEHHVSDSPSEGPGYDRSIWDTVNLSDEAQFYGEINSALAQLDAANIHLDPSTVENDGSNATQSLLFPWASKRTDCPAMLSIGSGRAANQECNDGSCLRDKRNAFLIECKLRGLSYKDIKRIGGFKEAESTLRGRFRTLTKSKEQRVRKPQWHQNDIRLLCEAVNVLSEATDQEHGHYSFCWAQIDNQLPKVSWKRVAQYIRTHGGSYHFGNATCKKKWCEVHGVKI